MISGLVHLLIDSSAGGLAGSLGGGLIDSLLDGTVGSIFDRNVCSYRSGEHWKTMISVWNLVEPRRPTAGL